MISVSQWGMFEHDMSWLDRGDGLPVFWEQFREDAMDRLRRWAKDRDDRLMYGVKGHPGMSPLS